MQVEPRFRKRIPCRVASSARSSSGMVLNVSRSGLFVQVAAGLEPGDEVALDLEPDGGATIPVRGRVVWRRLVGARLRSVTQGGVGVQLQGTPDAYADLVSGIASSREAREPGRTPEATPIAPRPRYRVRLKQCGKPRSRWLEVAAPSESEARAEALTRLGDGWEVLEVERSRS